MIKPVIKVKERDVKKRVVEVLKTLGAYYFYPMSHGYSSSGVADIVCCIKGRFVAIECKAGGNKPTALQQLNIDRVRATGGHAFVIDDSWTTETITELLTMIEETK